MTISAPALAKAADQKTILGWLVWTAGFSLAAWLAAVFGFKLALGIPLVLLLLVLGFLDYPKFLLFAVFIRSSLDAFTNVSVTPEPVALNPAALLGLALVILTPIHCWRRSAELKFPVARGLLFFLAMSIPAVFAAYLHFGTSGSVALKEFIRLTSLLCLMVSLLVFFRTPAETKRLFYAALASLAVPLAVGFHQAAAGTGDIVSTIGQNRIFGTLFHPNVLGLYLAVFLSVVIAWHRNAPSNAKKLLLGVILAAQFLTFSMGALVAAGLVFAAFLWQDKSRRAVGLVFLFLLLSGFFLFSKNWQDRFQQVAEMQLTSEVEAGEISNSFSWRVLHWYVLLQFAREHPLTGWGLLTTEKVTPWKTDEGQGFAAHNDIVRLFLETGAVGLGGYLVFLFLAGRWIFRLREDRAEGGGVGLATPLKGIFLTLLVLSAGAEEPLVHTAFMYYFFTFLVLAKNGFHFANLNPATVPADKR